MSGKSTLLDRREISRVNGELPFARRPKTFTAGELYLLRIPDFNGVETIWETVTFLAYSADPGLSVVERDGRRDVVSRRNLFQPGRGSRLSS